MTPISRLREHWPEYLIEGWALGMFMLSAALFTTLFEYPGSPARQAIGDADLRRGLIGIAMGLTAIGLIYSPWGKRSGAHMNPAVTLSFLRLGKIDRWDALFFIIAQFIGGIAGVLIASFALGDSFTQHPVNYVATLPGEAGVGAAFGAEWLISALLFLTVLVISNHDRFAMLTGIAAGVLVALYITVEAPLSGMSMNPARSFASAVPGQMLAGLWLYFIAPVLGMLAAAEAYRRLGARRSVHCAKLVHPDDVACIHCGHRPPDVDGSPSTQTIGSTSCR